MLYLHGSNGHKECGRHDGEEYHSRVQPSMGEEFPRERKQAERELDRKHNPGKHCFKLRQCEQAAESAGPAAPQLPGISKLLSPFKF